MCARPLDWGGVCILPQWGQPARGPSGAAARGQLWSFYLCGARTWRDGGAIGGKAVRCCAASSGTAPQRVPRAARGGLPSASVAGLRVAASARWLRADSHGPQRARLWDIVVHRPLQSGLLWVPYWERGGKAPSKRCFYFPFFFPPIVSSFCPQRVGWHGCSQSQRPARAACRQQKKRSICAKMPWCDNGLASFRLEGGWRPQASYTVRSSASVYFRPGRCRAYAARPLLPLPLANSWRGGAVRPRPQPRTQP